MRYGSVMTTDNRNDPGDSYDAVADEYVRRILRELEHKPFDRELLDRFACDVKSGGTVADIGCGPGHLGRHLHERGLRICGLDLSAQMVERARQLNPGSTNEALSRNQRAALSCRSRSVGGTTLCS